jgi:hypothetical protein
MGAVLVTVVVMFLTIGETFTASDLSRIDSAETKLLTACHAPVNRLGAHRALSTLIGYLHRDPGQLIALHGADPADSMRAELTGLQASLAQNQCRRDPELQATLDHVLAVR